MIRRLVNSLFRWYFDYNYQRIRYYMDHPHAVQMDFLKHLVNTTKHTEWGHKHGYNTIRNYRDFTERVPVQDYETLKPYIDRMMHGERDVLWSGQVRWFSKSSGTTNDKSKFIPVSGQNLRKCHIQGTWDTMTLYYRQYPDSRIFLGKGLAMGGSFESFKPYPRTSFGDVSAIMLQHFPFVGRPFYAPDFDIALMSNWEEKIEKMALSLIAEDMRMLGGVPTWTIVLFRRILELTGKRNLLEVWPNLEVYVHGGVSFTPYREQFRAFLPGDQVRYLEIYNASEGFFAIQDNLASDDMLLLLDNGIFYEFLPVSEWDKEHPVAVPLSEVQVGQHYAMVISTNGGLWRYLPGDTVMFTSTAPYKIRVTGRTKQYVNAFGEEVMVANTDKALAETCRQMPASVAEYTVAPVYFTQNGKGGHEWLVEFDKPPADIEVFSMLLDENLQRINSDYEAKRFKNMALERLRLKPVPKGTFHNWLRMKGKYGGQHKVPRLANHRQYVEEILQIARQSI